MEFSAEHQPKNKIGRPVGSKNKRSQFSDTMTKVALEKLNLALNEGEQWAVETVLKRTHPQLKAITPRDSIDGEYLTLKMKEIAEFEQRLAVLEQRNDKQ